VPSTFRGREQRRRFCPRGTSPIGERGGHSFTQKKSDRGKGEEKKGRLGKPFSGGALCLGEDAEESKGLYGASIRDGGVGVGKKRAVIIRELRRESIAPASAQRGFDGRKKRLPSIQTRSQGGVRGGRQ